LSNCCRPRWIANSRGECGHSRKFAKVAALLKEPIGPMTCQREPLAFPNFSVAHNTVATL